MKGKSFVYNDEMKDMTTKQQQGFLCYFLERMLDKTDNKQEVERAVEVLNESLYEYGFNLSMAYDSRDGSASIAG